MIRGVVNALLEPIVPLRVFDRAGQGHDLDALVDSGFTHFLTLPPDVIALLRLMSLGPDILRSADGTVQILNTFYATIDWDGQQVPVLVHEIDGAPLIGMRQLNGCRAHIACWDGGAVQIEKRP